MVPKAYMQGLLKQIAMQIGALGDDQFEYSELGSSLADQMEYEPAQRVIMFENSNRPIIV